MAVDSAALESRFAAPQQHPLPAQLAEACSAAPDVARRPTDYFSAIRPLPVGYLIWSQFPIPIYVELLTNDHESVAARWAEATALVLQDWGQYLPLQTVSDADTAAIRLYPVQPPFRYSADGTFRAQSGDTRYELYVQESGAPVLRHRLDVRVKPGQAARQLEASIRHELGHALGIWGHSRSPKDALYYSQVAAPPAVSAGDVATLCEVYRQPTSLGWPLVEAN